MMDLGKLSFALSKMREDYKLSEDELKVLRRRLMADDKEFERVWGQYLNRRVRGGGDSFREVLSELLN